MRLRDQQHLVDAAREGVKNLVRNCAEVEPGEMVVLVNDSTRTTKAVSDLIEATVEAMGARTEVLWVEPAEPTAGPQQLRSARFTLETEQVATLLKADRVIANADDETLVRYLADADKNPVLATHRSKSVEDLASAPARYPWGIAQALFNLMENEVFQVGRAWRVTSPSGTDLKGVVADRTLRAVFVEDQQRSRNLGRTFSFGTYLPVASMEAEGVLVVEWMEGRALKVVHDPPYLEIQANKITNIGGGLEQPQWLDEYYGATERLLQRFGDNALVVDSWHGGTHPWASSWAGGTRHLHFHMGRTTGADGDFVFAGVKDLTLEVDGQAVIRNGRPALFDHPKVQAAAEQYGMDGWKDPWPRSDRWLVRQLFPG